MKMEVVRQGIKIIPENDTDIAFIEEVLKLRAAFDSIRLVRSNVVGMSCIAYLETDSDYVRSRERAAKEREGAER